MRIHLKRSNLKIMLLSWAFGLNGRNVSRVLSASGIPFVVLEINPETVRLEKKRGIPIHYGDASREPVLVHANIKMARCVVVAISDASATRRIVELTRRLNPSIYIIARTRYVSEVDPLYALGANDVIRKSLRHRLRFLEEC